MIATAVGLVALTLAELVSGGLSGRPCGRGRSLLGVGTGVGAAGAACWLFDLRQDGWFLALVILGTAGWLLVRSGDETSSRRASLALWALGLYLAILIGFGGVWQGAVPSIFRSWIEGLPYGRLSHQPPDRLLLEIGVLLVLTAPSNGLVRAVLCVAGSAITTAEERLRGGRYIGILERLLVFGLAIGGELAAAALIASAKSILRFPELSRVAEIDGQRHEKGGQASAVADVDVVTEYFLLGSLVSWFAALAPVLLLVG